MISKIGALRTQKNVSSKMALKDTSGATLFKLVEKLSIYIKL
jgi:hypothetical protein